MSDPRSTRQLIETLWTKIGETANRGASGVQESILADCEREMNAFVDQIRVSARLGQRERDAELMKDYTVSGQSCAGAIRNSPLAPDEQKLLEGMLEAERAKPAREWLEEFVKPLKEVCDRDWTDETPEQVLTIAANGIYWRRQEWDALLRKREAAARLEEAEWWLGRRGASDECLERIAKLKSEAEGQ